jgi:hypothetical protein
MSDDNLLMSSGSYNTFDLEDVAARGLRESAVVYRCCHANHCHQRLGQIIYRYRRPHAYLSTHKRRTLRLDHTSKSTRETSSLRKLAVKAQRVPHKR